jgi:hypothetical protein
MINAKGISIMKINKARTTASLLLTGLMIVGVAGCSSAPKDGRSAGRQLDDEHLTARIQKNLDEDPVYKFNGVHIHTFAGEVQLSGFVNTDAQKRRAAEIASQTPGANRVLDALALTPTAPTPTGQTGEGSQSRIYAAPVVPAQAAPVTPPATPSEQPK